MHKELSMERGVLMESIIVTVTNTDRSPYDHSCASMLFEFFYDIELPTNVVVNQLLQDIVDTLKAYDSNIISYMNLDASNIKLLHKRKGTHLELEKTLEDQGVWDGDYIIVLA